MSPVLPVADLLRQHDKASRATIELEARAAAAAGRSIDDACPYPFTSDEARHFKAVYLCALPSIRRCDSCALVVGGAWLCTGRCAA